MTIRRRSGLKCRSLLLAGMLTMGSSGCSVWDNPGYVYAVGVATGVMDGLITTTLVLLSEAVVGTIDPNQQPAP